MNSSVLTVLIVAVAALGFGGLKFLYDAVDRYTDESARTPGLIAGISCLVIATFLLVLAAVMTRRDGGPPHA